MFRLDPVDGIPFTVNCPSCDTAYKVEYADSVCYSCGECVYCEQEPDVGRSKHVNEEYAWQPCLNGNCLADSQDYIEGDVS